MLDHSGTDMQLPGSAWRLFDKKGHAMPARKTETPDLRKQAERCGEDDRELPKHYIIPKHYISASEREARDQRARAALK
jgi:hypothetical protein